MINITFTADPLPADFSGSLQDFQTQFLINLRGSIAETDVLTGQIGGIMPTTNVGPWLNNDTWFVWNGVEYVPSTVKVGGSGYIVQLGSPTTVGDSKEAIVPSRTQLLQDKDGTVALLSDVYVGRACVSLTGTNPTIDFNLGHHFAQTLSGNTTYKIANSQDGQRIAISVRNNATSYTVTWPSNVFWPSGAPTQTASKTDVYLIENIGGSLFGRQIANY